MKRIPFLILLTTFLMIGALPAETLVKKDTASVPVKKPHDQTVDLMTGAPINKKIFTDIQGLRVYHDSKESAAKFKADPETYLKKAAADQVRFKNIQAFCPISGDNISKKFSVDYQGRKVYFCCRDCVSKFSADPAAMIKRLDWPADSVKNNSLMQMEDEGDGHEQHH